VISRKPPGICTGTEPRYAAPRNLHVVVPCSARLRITTAATGGQRGVACGCCPGRVQPRSRPRRYLSLGHERCRGGRHRAAAARAGLAHNGPVWRAMPADLPHWRTVYHYVRA
jgi:hypothetical protein